MKKLFILLFSVLLLLCSCRGGNTVITDDASDTSANAPTTADVNVFSAAKGFDKIYDEKLNALWVYKAQPKIGLLTRIIVYDSNKITFRVLCTDSAIIEYNGKSYEIKDGGTIADAEMLSALKNIAEGGACRIGERDITNEERLALSDTLKLYDAAFGETYSIETESITDIETEEDESGDLVYNGDGFSIKYPSSFHAEYDNGILTIISGTRKLRTVTVRRSSAVFSPLLADKEDVEKNIAENGGQMISEIIETTVDKQTAYRFRYLKDGVYIIQYFIDGGDSTYIMTAGSYDEYDTIPDKIISTFKLK